MVESVSLREREREGGRKRGEREGGRERERGKEGGGREGGREERRKERRGRGGGWEGGREGGKERREREHTCKNDGLYEFYECTLTLTYPTISSLPLISVLLPISHAARTHARTHAHCHTRVSKQGVIQAGSFRH